MVKNKQIQGEMFDLQPKSPVVLYGRDRGFALFSKGEGLWQVEQEIGGVLYKRVVHETHIEWVKND